MVKTRVATATPSEKVKPDGIQRCRRS
jgi:hypothetical protein